MNSRGLVLNRSLLLGQRLKMASERRVHYRPYATMPTFSRRVQNLIAEIFAATYQLRDCFIVERSYFLLTALSKGSPSLPTGFLKKHLGTPNHRLYRTKEARTTAIWAYP